MRWLHQHGYMHIYSSVTWSCEEDASESESQWGGFSQHQTKRLLREVSFHLNRRICSWTDPLLFTVWHFVNRIWGRLLAKDHLKAQSSRLLLFFSQWGHRGCSSHLSSPFFHLSSTIFTVSCFRIIKPKRSLCAQLTEQVKLEPSLFETLWT